jgi:hypothetical protein
MLGKAAPQWGHQLAQKNNTDGAPRASRWNATVCPLLEVKDQSDARVSSARTVLGITSADTSSRPGSRVVSRENLTIDLHIGLHEGA